jgi:hypothetical protein
VGFLWARSSTFVMPPPPPEMPSPTILSATNGPERHRRCPSNHHEIHSAVVVPLPPPLALPEMRNPTIPRLDVTSPVPVDTAIAASSTSRPSTTMARIRS